MKLSIVTTLYKSSEYVKEFYERVSKQASAITDDYEIIYVNDGSPDDSVDIAISLYDSCDKVKVVDLSRNFGHHKAILTGLKYAEGDFIFLVDSDLEEPPELLADLWAKLHSEDDADVVFGVQKKRKGGLFERISGGWFYKFFNYISHTKLPNNLSTIRIMSRRYVDSLLMHDERTICIAGLWAITGYNQIPFYFDKLNNSETTYSFSTKLTYTINMIVSFSSMPLAMIFYAGFIALIIAFMIIFYTAYNYFFREISVSGYTSLIVSIWLLGGSLLFSMGLIGIYMSKLFEEIKARPVIVKKFYK